MVSDLTRRSRWGGGSLRAFRRARVEEEQVVEKDAFRDDDEKYKDDPDYNPNIKRKAGSSIGWDTTVDGLGGAVDV